jgi:hypothetical protein
MSVPTTARSGSGKLAGEKRARQPNFFPDKCIYLISLDDAAYTTATLQETRGTTLLFLVAKTRASVGV